MITTLDAIHRDPKILDRAIERRESLDIIEGGVVAATLIPSPTKSLREARSIMSERFASPDWSFSVGTPLNRDERNSRG